MSSHRCRSNEKEAEQKEDDCANRKQHARPHATSGCNMVVIMMMRIRREVFRCFSQSVSQSVSPTICSTYKILYRQLADSSNRSLCFFESLTVVVVEMMF